MQYLGGMSAAEVRTETHCKVIDRDKVYRGYSCQVECGHLQDGRVIALREYWPRFNSRSIVESSDNYLHVKSIDNYIICTIDLGWNIKCMLLLAKCEIYTPKTHSSLWLCIRFVIVSVNINCDISTGNCVKCTRRVQCVSFITNITFM